MIKKIEGAVPYATKTAKMLTHLQTGTSASLEDIADVTHWQLRKVCAAMTALRKKGHMFEKHIDGNITIWSARIGKP